MTRHHAHGRRHRRTLPRLLAFLPLLLAGCDQSAGDPLQKPGTWHASGVNDANLRVMIANPQDLVVGADEPGSLGVQAAAPARALLSGRRAALPALNAAAVDVSNTPPSAPPNAPAQP